MPQGRRTLTSFDAPYATAAATTLSRHSAGLPPVSSTGSASSAVRPAKRRREDLFTSGCEDSDAGMEKLGVGGVAVGGAEAAAACAGTISVGRRGVGICRDTPLLPEPA